MGLALAGDPCVAEIQFCDYIFNTMDLLKMVGNTHWVSNGNYSMPLTVMTPVGAGIHGSIYHSHSFDAWATRMPGWKIVMPSTPLDAYGLLLSAIKDPNPVLFLKPKALLRVRGEELIPGEPESEKELKDRIDAPLGDRSHWKPRWPKLKEVSIQIGEAKVVRQGQDVSIVTYGRHVFMACEAADQLKKEKGVEVEVIDLRSLYPYDWNCIKTSVAKTGRVLFVNEDTEVTNFGEHLCYRVTRELFYHLLARPRVLAAKNLPGVGLYVKLEENTIPQSHDIMKASMDLFTEIP